MADFVLLTMDWYRQNARVLPWRNTKNPYFIWLSEVILQQTRVDQGLNYYLHFTSKYPTVQDLANASEDEILKSWQGLGYYSRARNLHKTAQLISQDFMGQFPNSYDQLIRLKGIGPYSAAAISSFAFDEPRAVLDGNVFRVLSRYFGIDEPIDTTSGKKLFQQLVDELLPHNSPALFNQAIMEFGACCCTPKLAKCSSCPLSESCASIHTEKLYLRPVKSKKTKVTNRYFHYFQIIENKFTYIHQRTENGIWKGLFEFPVFESKDAIISEEELFQLKIDLPEVHFSTKHILSHQHIHARFYQLKVLPEYFKSEIKIEVKNLGDLAIPRLIEKYLEYQQSY